MMDIILNVLKWSAAVGVAALLVSLTKPLLDRRWSAKWRYPLWLVLAALLLLSPVRWEALFPAVTSPALEVQVPEISLTAPAAPAQVPSGTPAGGPSGAPPATTPATPPAQLTPSVPSGPTAPVPDAPEAPAAPEQARSVTLGQILVPLWLTGAAVFLLWYIAGTLRFTGRVRRWSRPAPERVEEIFEGTAREMGVSRRPTLTVSSAVSTPMALGLFRHVLVLPEGDWDEGELRFILRHELTHIARRDLLYKAFVLAANALHWFNPLVWLLRREANETLEMLCDARAVEGLDISERRAYCEVILSGVRRSRNLRGAVLSTYFYGGVRVMKNRFKNLLTERRRFGWTVLLALVLAVTVCACAVGLTSRTDDGEEPDGGDAGELWEGSLDLTARDYDTPQGDGFTLSVTGLASDAPAVETSGGFGALNSVILHGGGLDFSLEQTGENRSGLSEWLHGLEAGATYVSGRENTIDDKLENTPELQSIVETYFRVYVDGALRHGEMQITRGNGHTDFSFLFDDPITAGEAESALVFVVAGNSGWMAAHDPAAPREPSRELTAEELAEYEARFNSLEMNGFVAQMYTDVRELDLLELLYNGAGLSESWTPEAYAAFGDPGTDTFSVPRDTADAWLYGNTGIHISDLKCGTGEFFTREGDDTLYWSHGDTNYTEVTVSAGTASGDTVVLTVETPGNTFDGGYLTLTGGKIVSFTSPVHAALTGEMDRYTSRVLASIRRVSGADAWADCLINGSAASARGGDGSTTGVYLWEYAVTGTGLAETGYYLDDPDIYLITPDYVDPAVQSRLIENGDGYGTVATVIRRDADGTATVLATHPSASVLAWRGRWDELAAAYAPDDTGTRLDGYDPSAEIGDGFSLLADLTGGASNETDGGYGAVSLLTFSRYGVRFKIEGDPAWLSGLETAPALYLGVLLDGSPRSGVLSRLPDGTWNYVFTAPLDGTGGVGEVYIAAGTPLWVADHALVYRWSTPINFVNRCQTYSSDYAHVYYLSQAGVMHGGFNMLLSVWPDGSSHDYLADMPQLGPFSFNTSYYAQNIALSADGRTLTFDAPLYIVTGEGMDAVLEDRGMGSFSVDLATRQLTQTAGEVEVFAAAGSPAGETPADAFPAGAELTVYVTGSDGAETAYPGDRDAGDVLTDALARRRWTAVPEGEAEADNASGALEGKMTVRIGDASAGTALTVWEGGTRAALREGGTTAVWRVDDPEGLWSDVMYFARTAALASVWDVTVDGELDMSDAGAAITEKIAENLASLPGWVQWGPEDARAGQGGVYDAYLGDPEQFCFVLELWLRLDGSREPGSAWDYWCTGSGLPEEPDGKGEREGYFRYAREALVVRSAGGWQLSGTGTGGCSVILPGWSLTQGAPDCLDNATVDELIGLMTLTAGVTHDELLTSRICARPEEELAALPDLLAALPDSQAREIYAALDAYLVDGGGSGAPGDAMDRLRDMLGPLWEPEQ